MSEHEKSILNDVKKYLGLDSEYKVFDQDVIAHINSAFFTLTQLGVGPKEGFYINDETSIWSDYGGGSFSTSPLKTYIYIRARILFDPPTTSFALDALQKQAVELEWRLNVYAEGPENPWNTIS